MHVTTKHVFKRAKGNIFGSCHSLEHIRVLELGEVCAMLKIMSHIIEPGMVLVSSAPDLHMPTVAAQQASSKLISGIRVEGGIPFCEGEALPVLSRQRWKDGIYKHFSSSV